MRGGAEQGVLSVIVNNIYRVALLRISEVC